MRMSRRWRLRRWGLATGGLVTLLGCALHLCGALTWLDHAGFDFHVRYFSSIPADERIVMVDIDDQSLRAAPWPWPRRKLADLVRMLDELGARSIVLDLVLDEPTPPRRDHAGLRDIDIDPELTRVGDPAEDPIVFDDRELEAALADARAVYLAMFFPLAPPGVSVAETYLFKTGGLEERQARRIAARIEEDFGLNDSELIEESENEGAEAVRRVQAALPAIKRHVARQKAKLFLSERPGGTFRDFFEAVLRGHSFDALTQDRAELSFAYRWADAERAVTSTSSFHAAGDVRLASAGDGTYPLAAFAQAADGVGMVSFLSSASGGVVRSLPIAAQYATGRVFLQLGLLPALDFHAGEVMEIAPSPDGLVLRSRFREVRFPMDRNGATPVNWHVAGSGRWEDSFRHVPAARLLEVVQLREALRENEDRYGMRIGELMAVRHLETPLEYARYEKALREFRAMRDRRGRRAGLEGSDNSKELARLANELGTMRLEALQWLTRLRNLWKDVEPESDEEKKQAYNIRRLHLELVERDAAAELAALNGKLAQRIDELTDDLRQEIHGKICFVGYTASALADMVAVPAYPAMPGVMAHANVCNMALQNRPLRPWSGVANVALLLAAGGLMTIAAALRGPLVSAATLAVLALLIVAMGGAAFQYGDQVAASFPAVAGVAGAWAAVTAYRQLTEERARRHFERALKQYTSPAVAARIAEDFDSSALAPRPARVTCFFADLAGFTPLSARLGPDRTRSVLNPFLAMMSRELTEQGALINKFVGDGVFAFFNAPILPCAMSAAAACRTATSAQSALADLNRRLAPILGDARLRMRMGISSGDVFVGDFGSDTKLDYTCLGNAVNLGSRLEAAGKVLGAETLVDEATRLEAGEDFAFRPLGRFEVAGFASPVSIFELLGWTDQLNARDREFLDRFALLVQAYQTCRLEDCRAAVQACLALRPRDLTTLFYSRAVSDAPGGAFPAGGGVLRLASS